MIIKKVKPNFSLKSKKSEKKIWQIVAQKYNMNIA
jgi:hypothetical protein